MGGNRMSYVKKLIILMIVVIGVIAYVGLCRCIIMNRVNKYIAAKGYSISNIKDLDIRRSFLNRVLGYDEWGILVEFDKAPDVFFCFSYRKGEVSFEGVETVYTEDKVSILEYSERFENGTLLDE